MSSYTNHTFPGGTYEGSIYEEWIIISYKERQLPDSFFKVNFLSKGNVSV